MTLCKALGADSDPAPQMGVSEGGGWLIPVTLFSQQCMGKQPWEGFLMS